jgi:two-component system, OmpR family, KDP operon response regulator KdpE
MSETKARILVVDDERAIRRFLRTSLAVFGYEIDEAVDGQEAINLAATHHPDLVILDLSLPDMDGVDVLKRIREWSTIPVIILTVRESENDKIVALDAGADDYLTKPFGVGELTARIRVALRHTATGDETQPVLKIQDLELDLVKRLVKLNGEEVSLTPTEYELIKIFFQNAGKVLTHHQLLHLVWGVGYEEEAHILRVNISNLRRKIETDPARPGYILTESGVGYRFRAMDEN